MTTLRGSGSIHRILGTCFGLGRSSIPAAFGFGRDWLRRVWLFDKLVWSIASYGIKIWGWQERNEIKSMQERFLRWVFGVKRYVPGYIVREELQREKLKGIMSRRAWGYEKRLESGKKGFLAQCRRNFPARILWTDEALFTPNGIFNSKNFILWAHDNPRAVRQGAFQYRWALNVWAGVIADRVIGPYFFPARLNGEIYANFLQNELPVLLEDLPLQMRVDLILQQDGAPPHFSRRARNVLDNVFAERWMGRGGPITWPARSPDMNVLDYFIWGHVKAQVEHMRERNVNEVRDAIIAAFGAITPQMIQRATQQIVQRAELCLQTQGRHFEQLLR
ncbi:uncharacterized protein [Cardiocondyla obscurior]|uniref:uncharacterized protein n=1 Tax=Cardiocondyla obscurior TaxID=286306 RepID=UPI003965686A